MSKLSDRLRRIEELLEELVAVQRKHNNYLEHPRDDFYPAPTYPAPPMLNSPTCPKCGIELKGSMSYSCNRHDCPTGLGPIMCTTS